MGRGGTFFKRKTKFGLGKTYIFSVVVFWAWGLQSWNHDFFLALTVMEISRHDHHAWFNHGVLEKDQL